MKACVEFEWWQRLTAEPIGHWLRIKTGIAHGFTEKVRLGTTREMRRGHGAGLSRNSSAT